MFFGLAILCLATVPVALCEKIHERMSLNQVAQIFQKTHHSLVPDYEIVQFKISRRNRRNSASPQSLISKAFGHDIRVWLHPPTSTLATVNTPVFEARTIFPNSNVHYRIIPDAMRKVGRLYEDPQQRASLIVETNSKGQHSIDGFIGSKNLVVRSLPESISYDLMQNHSFYDSKLSKKSRTTRSAYHVVFKAEEMYSEKSAKMFGLNDSTPIFRVHDYASEKLRDNVVFPEIMVVLDYDFYELHGYNLKSILTYVLAFWNGVDLLYRNFEQPKIRFNIARIIIATDYTATPYISQNQLDNGSIDHRRAWKGAEMYYFDTLGVFDYNSYDAVMTMTGRALANDYGNPNMIGVATIGGMCDIDYYQKLVLRVAITKDDGRFGNVMMAAHEIGHLLNATHDGYPTSCDGKAGYIMGAVEMISPNFYDFSKCSVDMFDQFFRIRGKNCMANEPEKSNNLPRFLPGEIVDRNEQCVHLGYQDSCYNGSEQHFACSATYCHNRYFTGRCDVIYSSLPPDGTFCDHGKICLHGYCV